MSGSFASGVRMVRFRSVLKRYESEEINQNDAAEMLGKGWVFSKLLARSARLVVAATAGQAACPPRRPQERRAPRAAMACHGG